MNRRARHHREHALGGPAHAVVFPGKSTASAPVQHRSRAAARTATGGEEGGRLSVPARIFQNPHRSLLLLRGIALVILLDHNALGMAGHGGRHEHFVAV